MDCHDFEARFEAYLDGGLPAAERAACATHAAGCASCRELLELAGPPVAAGAAGAFDDLVAPVLERTSGSACGRAGGLLASRWGGGAAGDDVLGPLDRELLELHLASCESCRGLAQALAALARDLPALASVRPDPAFVDDVLAATRPAGVRWRRLAAAWSGHWAAWVRRPRFALEAAFVLTLVFLPVVTSSATPLAPVAETARELSGANPLPKLEGELRHRWIGTVQAVEDLPPVEEAGATVAAARGTLDDLAAGAGTWAEHTADAWAGRVADTLGTLRSAAASFLMKADDDEAASGRPAAADGTNLTDPTTTRAAGGSKGETR